MPRISKADAVSLAAREMDALPARYAGCLMCAMADAWPAELEVLSSNARAVAVLNRFAARRGHVIVVLRRHVEPLPELPWEEYAAVQRLAWEAAQAAARVLRPRRVFVAALGAATRLSYSFPHHHVHVVPLDTDGEESRPSRVFSWEDGVHVDAPGEARALADALRASWPPGGAAMLPG